MTVALVGYTQGAFSATGHHTVSWPSGTAANHLGVVFCGTGKDGTPVAALPAGWQCRATTSDGVSVWFKSLTAADIAVPLEITARVQALQVFSGSSSISAVTRSESSFVEAGEVLLMCGWKSTNDTLTMSAKIHADDIVNELYLYKDITRKMNTWSYAATATGTATIDTNASAFLTVRVLKRSAPFQPTLLAPEDGAFFDNQTPIALQWRHNSASGAPQSMIDLLLSYNGGSTFTSPLYALPYTESSYVWTPPVGTDGVDWWWAIRTWAGAAGDSYVSPASAWRKVSTRTKPSVAAASVTGSGLAHTVSWTPTITNGAQTWWRVRITPAAATTPDVPLYDSGVTAGTDTSMAIPPIYGWTNGGSYTAWVEFGQTGGQQSDPVETSPFTVSWTLPDPPANATVQAAVPGSQPTRVTVNGMIVGRKARLTFTANGTTYTFSKTADTTSVTFDVPLAPYNTPTTYTAEQSGTVSGLEVWSNPVTVAAVATDKSSYLVAVDGLSWRRVRIFKASEPEDTEGVTVSYGLGSSTPTVMRTPSQGLRGTDVLVVETQAEKTDLKAWLAANPTFVFRRPPERSRASYVDVPAIRVARADVWSEARPVNSQLQLRTVPLSWVQQ